MKILFAFVDLILYSNFFVALAAMSMVWQAQILADSHMQFSSSYGWLVFCATLIIYAIHRVIGFTVIKQTIETRRVRVIRKFRGHIIGYAILAVIPLVWLSLQMPAQTISLLGLAAILSLAYVIPLFRKRRLRDLPFIKVFVVALIWSLVTTVIPAIQNPISNASLIWLALEKSLFILALILPFDVRDLDVDANHRVDTFATKYGVSRALRGANLCVLLAMFLVIVQTLRGFYFTEVAVALLLSYIYVLIVIRMSHKPRHDYFYTGAVDGAMLLQWVLVVSVH